MRLLLPLVVCLVLCASCKNEQPDYKKLIQGNWECKYEYNHKYRDTVSINLQFFDTLCHFYIFQNDGNTFSARDSLIVIDLNESRFLRNKPKQQILKIIRADHNILELISVRGLLNDSYELTPQDTLRFFKAKRRNNLQIRRISFYSSGCYGTCPSFKMEMNPNDSIKLESYAHSVENGAYTGKSSPLFWKTILDKAAYIDFENWEENYNAGWTDDQTCNLVFETNKGMYQVSIYGDDKEPRALRNIIWYIFSNYETFKLKKVDEKDVEFAHDNYSRKHKILPEEKSSYSFHQ